jgi:riboflavin kinase/FMN adenylyltransferase
MVVTHGSLQPTRSRCALTIGNFDGVHRGHRALHRAGDRQGARALRVLLRPDLRAAPARILRAAAAPARLTRLRDKLELLAAAGSSARDRRFDARFAALGASASSRTC